MQVPHKYNYLDRFNRQTSRTVYLLFAVFIFLFQFSAKANTDSTGVKNINGKIFVLHQVEKGQGLYGIARRYHCTVPDIQRANSLTGTTIIPGKIILVPYSGSIAPVTKSLPVKQKNPDKKPVPQITKNNPVKSDNFIVKSGREPILHTITKKETLHTIAINHKLTEQQLKDWNHSDLNILVPGDKMIVGFKGKKVPEAIKKTEIKKTEPKKTDSKKTDKTAKSKNENKKVTKEEPIVELPKVPGNASKRIVTENGMGTWVDDGSIKTEVSLAMHKSAPAGTIIKLTNPMNNKVKYVKVVGSLPDIDENKNILIKISKNTADELGIIDKNFRVNLEYAVEDTTGN